MTFISYGQEMKKFKIKNKTGEVAVIPCKKKNPGLLLHNGRYWYRYKNEIGSFYIHDERVYYV